MKLTAVIQLLPIEEQRQILYETLQTLNAACNEISQQAWDSKTFRRVPLHHLTYYPVREQFGLTAQMAVRCIGKVTDAYKVNRKVRHDFRKHGAIPYDLQMIRYDLEQQAVNLQTLDKRQTMPFAAGQLQLDLLQYQQGESDLFERRGKFYIAATCEIPDDVPFDPDEFLGVDLGIKNIATDSDGTIHSAKHLLNVRHRHRRLRRNLQPKTTWSSYRKLKNLSGKERRFARDVNHRISKQLVTIAKDTGRGIALEDLKGIRDRTTFSRKQRNMLHSWSFYQLRQFVEYKAQRAGVPVVYIDPCNTSRECSVCGCVDKANRKTQSHFSCMSCGFVAHADVNAAINIGRRVVVNPPNADGLH